VTDANATFTAGIGAVVAAGGANNVPVTCDGTSWRIGANDNDKYLCAVLVSVFATSAIAQNVGTPLEQLGRRAVEEFQKAVTCSGDLIAAATSYCRARSQAGDRESAEEKPKD